VKSLLVSSLLFSAPHALNLLAGHDTLRVVAQLVWAVLLGAVFGMLLLAGGSLWPVAALHGLGNAFIHANRLGQVVQVSGSSAFLLAIAPVPLVIYSALLLKRGEARIFG
jgi:membrane protease YdiL (CAAX protease family)